MDIRSPSGSKCRAQQLRNGVFKQVTLFECFCLEFGRSNIEIAMLSFTLKGHRLSIKAAQPLTPDLQNQDIGRVGERQACSTVWRPPLILFAMPKNRNAVFVRQLT